MLGEILQPTFALIFWGLIPPLGAIAFIGLIFNFIFSLFQIQEQTLVYLVKIIVATLTIIIIFPRWQANFTSLIYNCLEQIMIIGWQP